MLPHVKFSLQAYLVTDFKERENKATLGLATVIHDIPTPNSYWSKLHKTLNSRYLQAGGSLTFPDSYLT
jgi:hypothetical protein